MAHAAVVPPVVGVLFMTYFNARPDETRPDHTNKTVPKTVMFSSE